jgi:hypothetical protein
MGIDVYAHWKGQTEEEEAAQITGFSVVGGHVGYLREAYHGAPYATEILVPEGFRGSVGGVPIPAKVLRERLPEAISVVLERVSTLYSSLDPAERLAMLESFRDFVLLCEKKEAETGEPVRISVSW